MIVMVHSTLLQFRLKHSTSASALNKWYDLVSKADWNSLRDIQEMFPSADYVGNDRYVFNIKGNSYRLVAMIHFRTRTLYIRFIGTHAEYDKIEDCSKI